MAIHSQQIERYGGSHGVLDKNVVLPALARPQQRWHYDQTADLADLSASYLVGFGRAQGFNDGNKRTGLACALVFLSLNGVELTVSSGALYAITMAIANNAVAESDVASFLRQHT